MATAADFQDNTEDTVINDWFNFVAAEIYRNYGHKVRINRKSLHKFGRFANLGTTENEINYLGIEPVHSTTNSITHFSSSDAADMQTLRVEGMTISNGVLTFVAQNITLDGQTKTALTTPLARVTRIANVADTTETAGDVYIYEDGAVTGGIPNDLGTVGNVMAASDQTTLFAGTSVAGSNYFICTKLWAYLAKKTGGAADIKFKTRQNGYVYRTVNVLNIGTSTPTEHEFRPFYIIPPNSDIDVSGTGSTTGLDVCAGFDGFFADIVN